MLSIAHTHISMGRALLILACARIFVLALVFVLAWIFVFTQLDYYCPS